MLVSRPMFAGALDRDAPDLLATHELASVAEILESMRGNMPSERLVIAASWVAMLPMWLGLGNAGASLLWLAALLAVSIAAIRALGRVAPEPTQGNLPSVGLHWGRKDLAGDEI